MARKVGYVFEERYMRHAPWSIQYSSLVQPFKHWESPETKRRFHGLLAVTGLLDKLQVIRPTPATRAQLQLIHTDRYIDEIEQNSKRPEGGVAGEEAPYSQHAFEIACLSAGGVIAAAEAVMAGHVQTAYALTRPPGHHAEADHGMGFCLFYNVAITARHLLRAFPDQLTKIAIVDYDVHHGNGTQNSFYEDDQVLFISLHQDNNYPANSGNIDDVGKNKGTGFNINIPLPPGSGFGAYQYSFQQVVMPALKNYKPDFILVSSGFDCSYTDPLASMILSTRAFRFMAQQLIDVASEVAKGRIVFAHEGGYSEVYVPFCGTAVIEELLGVKESDQVKDPFLAEAERWVYQELQDHQRKVIDRAVEIHKSRLHSN
ncbi:TPA: hypothetical protein N0F65_007327 [Lagenidium giganteum]|uniref:Histone deacetylase domain-containing protein n=1 Tax=Lagenidium giganteum TaxID=4803 RepID=A0AAV2Z9X4_9STRA|nr:TPA: hypothetical protein N0F65_007327 [Lagenidium giganteum]